VVLLARCVPSNILFQLPRSDRMKLVVKAVKSAASRADGSQPALGESRFGLIGDAYKPVLGCVTWNLRIGWIVFGVEIAFFIADRRLSRLFIICVIFAVGALACPLVHALVRNGERRFVLKGNIESGKPMASST
jgi:hypothetical protein